LSYNVENLFDEIEDGGEYREYRGSKWTRELFQAKCRAVARVIREAVPGGPEVIALQEVESPRALEGLAACLEGMGYRYRVCAPRAGQATQVALLSRCPVLRTRLHEVPPWKGQPQRGILEAELGYKERTLYLFNNHWKSRSGGVAETEQARQLSARVLKARLQQILDREPRADILVLGDFNVSLEEAREADSGRYALAGPQGDGLLLTADSSLSQRAGELLLYEPWFELREAERGSTVYRGLWQTPDHILLSGGLFDASGFAYRRGGFRPLRKSFLLNKQNGYPQRWSSSFPERGFSDHLPLLISILVQQDR